MINFLKFFFTIWKIIHKRRSFDNFCNAYLKKKIFFKETKKALQKKISVAKTMIAWKLPLGIRDGLLEELQTKNHS